MSTRIQNLVAGEYYHLYNRGNSKQIIFCDAQDYTRFIELLYLTNSEKNIRLSDIQKRKENKESVIFDIQRDSPLIAIGAFCLMSNHFHILATPIAENGISKFMQKLTTSYSMYFNKKYKRTGSLFEGKFKSKHVADDVYLKYLYAYIHLNPIKKIDPTWKEEGIKSSQKALAYLRTYSASSFQEYAGIVAQKGIIDPSFFPEYFPTNDSFEKEIIAWIKK